jgi:16S rRNA (uracil1498-N3)-methyltransferase
MPDFRVHCDPADEQPTEIVLSRDESHHLVSVNRARVGDPVVAFNGRGTEWRCTVLDATKAAARLRVHERTMAQPLSFDLTLAQALPKGPAMDSIVRKATEIGAKRILPLETERTQVHLEGDRQDKKLEKWQIAALEAAKQCGNPWLPEFQPIQPIARFLAAPPPPGALRVIASLHPGAKSIKATLLAHRQQHGDVPRAAICLVGPEGDFSPAEVASAVAAGFQPITLGPLVLRCDTAAMYVLSVLSHELANG